MAGRQCTGRGLGERNTALRSARSRALGGGDRRRHRRAGRRATFDRICHGGVVFKTGLRLARQGKRLVLATFGAAKPLAEPDRENHGRGERDRGGRVAGRRWTAPQDEGFCAASTSTL